MSEKVKGKNLTPKQQDGLKTMGFVILCAAALFWWSTSQQTPGVDNTTSVEDDFTEQPPVLSNQDAPPPSPAPFITGADPFGPPQTTPMAQRPSTTQPAVRSDDLNQGNADFVLNHRRRRGSVDKYDERPLRVIVNGKTINLLDLKSDASPNMYNTLVAETTHQGGFPLMDNSRTEFSAITKAGGWKDLASKRVNITFVFESGVLTYASIGGDQYFQKIPEAPMEAYVPATEIVRTSSVGCSYVVKAGDTFRGIANRNGLSFEGLKQLNRNLASYDNLSIGDCIKIR